MPRAGKHANFVALGVEYEMCTNIVLAASFWGAFKYEDHKDLLSRNKF